MDHFEKQVEKLLVNDSFIRWIEEKASAEEVKRWEMWLQEDPDHKRLVERAKIIQNSIRFKHGTGKALWDLEEESSKLNRSIDEIESLKKGKVPMASVHKRLRYTTRIAAVIALLLMVSISLHFLYTEFEARQETVPTFLTTSTEYGQKKKLTLSDGSTIILNANSNLTYPPKRQGEDLEVWLEGEAYFDISNESNGEKRTFTVHSTDGKMKVLGTKFNVRTYQGGTEVVLEEGKVQVELRDTLNELQATHTMEPGDLSQFAYNENSIQVRKIKPELYTSWTNDKLLFDRTPLIEIAERIEHIYGVRFPIDDPELQQTRISGSVPNNNLSVLLKGLKKMLKRSVINKHGTIYLDTSTKEKED